MSADCAVIVVKITLELTRPHLVGGLAVWPRQDGLTVESFHYSCGIPRDASVELGDGDCWVTVWRVNCPST